MPGWYECWLCPPPIRRICLDRPTDNADTARKAARIHYLNDHYTWPEPVKLRQPGRDEV